MPPSPTTRKQSTGRKIRVGFEVSNLATSYGQAAWMGGIYRVTCSALRAAIKRDDIEPVLVANQEFISYGLIKRFQRETPDLAHLPVETSWRFAFLSDFLVWLMYDVFPNRIWRGRVFNQSNRFSVRKKRPLEFDAFQSFYTSLDSAEGIRAQARFLLVYDLIPILHPKYYNLDRPAEWFIPIVKSPDYQRDWVTCISESTKHDYCAYTGMSPERVFVTPLAASDIFRPITDKSVLLEMRSRLGIPSGRYVLSLCTLEPRKNLPHLVRCFLKMIKDHPELSDVNLVLAGAKGWLYDDIFKEIEANDSLKSRIIFVGRISDDDIAALYSEASLFVYPSLYEGFGLPPLEAMQCGVPVVTSNNSSLPEVVGDAGLMVDASDETALINAMLSVLNDNVLAADLRKRGIERARQFSWEHFMDCTVEAYKKALN